MALKPKKQVKVLKTITRDTDDLVIRLFGKHRNMILQLRFVGWIKEMNDIAHYHNVPDIDLISRISITQAMIKGRPNYNKGQINSFNKKQAQRALFRNLNRYFQFIVEKERGARLHEFVRPELTRLSLDPNFMEIIEQAKNNPSTEAIIKAGITGIPTDLTSEQLAKREAMMKKLNPYHPYPNPEDPVNFLYPHPIVALPIPKELGPDVEFDENGNMRNVD